MPYVACQPLDTRAAVETLSWGQWLYRGPWRGVLVPWEECGMGRKCGSMEEMVPHLKLNISVFPPLQINCSFYHLLEHMAPKAMWVYMPVVTKWLSTYAARRTCMLAKGGKLICFGVNLGANFTACMWSLQRTRKCTAISPVFHVFQNCASSNYFLLIWANLVDRT